MSGIKKERIVLIREVLNREDSFLDVLIFSCFSRPDLVSLLDKADRLAAIERQVLWRTEDMPKDAVGWWKRTWDNGEMECRYMNEDGDELHPEAPDHLPDDPVGPLFLPILDPPEGQ